MTRHEIITEVFQSTEARDAARLFAKRDWRELLSVTIMKLYDIPERQLIDIYERKKINQYVFITMRNQSQDPYKEYNKSRMGLNVSLDTCSRCEDIEPDNPADYVSFPEFDDFFAYCKSQQTSNDSYIRLCADTTVMYYTYEPTGKRTQRDFSKQTGINHTSISVYISEMRKRFKKHYESSLSTQ